MPMFRVPDLVKEDRDVLDELEAYRRRLGYALREPRRWTGNLRRNLQARAIRGSNTIEGYTVSLDDALAAVDQEEPLDADQETWAEIIGYRNALTYARELVGAPHFRYDVTLLSALHFMLIGHDLAKLPGRLRPGPIYVHDDNLGENVYEGPAADRVPGLLEELVEELRAAPGDVPVFVRAAMAHLNLVMIHPFKDGTGRMARVLQTLVLARDGILAPEFSSIEEYLGRRRNTVDYYAVLAQVGGGTWQPGNDARPWVRFNLRAHHIQAQTVLLRVQETAALWGVLEELAAREGFPERVVPALYDAASGFRVRRGRYELDADVEPGTATRDLRHLTRAGLLVSQGATRGRRYVAAERLRELRRASRAERPRVVDPYGRR